MSPSKKLSLLQQLQQRASKTGDSEPEQAIRVRLTIGFFIILYFCIPWQEHETFKEILFSTPSLITLTYYAGALCIAAMIILDPTPSPTRRVSGIFLDLVTLSVLMFHAGDESIFLFVIYLWVILGNGFRFGVSYLYTSLAVGFIGFLTAVMWGDYWQAAHMRPIGYSLLLLLISIPLYSAFLINKLHSAIRIAKFANEAKSRFLANMSHELRTPLNGVIGVADLLEETKMNTAQLELVSIMRNSANTLLSLIENVLDISKIEAGKIFINKENFDLHQLINSVVQMQSPLGRAKGIHVCCSIDAQIPYSVKGDPQHLRQVIINLLGNAVKFTESGSVKLLLQQIGEQEGQVKVRFEVIDTGIGIPEQSLGRIFDDFTQAHSANQIKYQGTGLGTTISKQLVELMGGEIGVESTVGQGSRFWFELAFETVSVEKLNLAEEKILILASTATADTLQQHLSSWSIKHCSVTSSAKAMTELMNASSTESPYSILLVEQSVMLDIEPIKYAKMLYAEQALENLSLVLINSEQAVVSDPTLNEFFVSSVNNIHDKRLLFNAIHAAQPIYHRDEKIIKLADHYAARNGKPLNILIAEDNLVNQKVLEGILTNIGHKVIIAATGETALDKLSLNLDALDLLILDMNMPEYSGVEILQALKFMAVKHIPCIMLTADATPEAKQRSLDAGADVFMTKPINSRQLIEEIFRLTEQDDSPATQSITATSLSKTNDSLNYQLISELKLLGGSASFFTTLIESFKADSAKHLAIISKAAHDDYLAFRESLHALKGSSTEIGAIKLAELCKQGEQMLPQQIDSPEIHQIVSQIHQIYDESLVKLIESAEQPVSEQSSAPN